jgi:hypothetical protein
MEDNMESIQEQVEYGGRCQHGTAIGTPGGADLMCGLCEDGFDTWVEDPYFTLTIRTGNGSLYRPQTGFWQSQLSPGQSVSQRRELVKFRRSLTFWSDLYGSAEVPAVFEMEQVRSGRWEQE